MSSTLVFSLIIWITIPIYLITNKWLYGGSISTVNSRKADKLDYQPICNFALFLNMFSYSAEK